LAGLIGAYIFGIQRKAQPPVFTPVSNPYSSGIYANGMLRVTSQAVKISIFFLKFLGPIHQGAGARGPAGVSGYSAVYH
jgi:HlyD family secretion protein